MIAKASTDYFAEVRARKKASANLSNEAKLRSLQSQVLSPDGSINKVGLGKVGQSYVGPILVRLKYEGIVRDILVERPLNPGQAPVFDVIDTLGVAYRLSNTGGAVKVQLFEGKRCWVDCFRIAAYPSLSQEDVYALNFDAINTTKDLAFNAMLEQEDSYLVGLLNSSITDYETKSGLDMTHVAGDATFQPADVHELARKVARQRLIAERLVVNAGDYYDLWDWGTDKLGWKAREEITDTGRITHYGHLQVKFSVMIPEGKGYALPKPEYIGYFPIRWSLKTTDNPKVAEGFLGWVMDESVGYLIVNPRGLVSMTKE